MRPVVFQRLDRHLNRRLKEGGRYAFAEVIFLALFPALVGMIIGAPLAFWLGATLSGILLSILAWRILFVLRLLIRAADHEYDAVGKYQLSREYWDTESATTARKREAK